MTNVPELIDIGANLGHESFAHDLPEVLSRARDAGVSHYLITGTTLPASERALALTLQYPQMSSTAGIHPHEARHADAEVLKGIRALLAETNVRAVGETGLDFNRDYSPRAVQEKVFAEHLAMAVEYGKPVFLHQRDSHERFLPILKEFRDQLVGGVVHCFTDSRDAMYAYLDLDMYIGITGWICDERRGQHLHDIVGDIPAQRLLLETDAPYLLPRTLRPRPKTRRNEPAWLPEVLRVTALHCGRPPAQLAMETTANARRLFSLPQDVLHQE